MLWKLVQKVLMFLVCYWEVEKPFSGNAITYKHEQTTATCNQVHVQSRQSKWKY